MPSNHRTCSTSFPSAAWSKQARSAAIRVISLAATCLTAARGKVARDSKRGQTTAFEVERLNQELALVREELRIKDMRWSRIARQRRPHYAPVERMAILEIKAARNWSTPQAAAAFHVTEATIASWMKAR